MYVVVAFRTFNIAVHKNIDKYIVLHYNKPTLYFCQERTF